MHSTLLLTSRANSRFRSIRAQVAASGAKRTHTLILGEKLIEAWAEGERSAATGRLHPLLWLRLEGVKSHPLEKELGVETLELGESLMRDLAEAGSAPNAALLVAVGSELPGPLAERVIVPWGIQDPGNLGAVLRSAAAFGFQEALLGPGCADPFSPKALRGSMGAAFLMPIRRCDALTLDGGHWYALHGDPAAIPIGEADLRAPLRILVGNEGHGWRDVALPEGVRFLAIPTEGVESLNAAVAAGIACYETARRGR